MPRLAWTGEKRYVPNAELGQKLCFAWPLQEWFTLQETIRKRSVTNGLYEAHYIFAPYGL